MNEFLSERKNNIILIMPMCFLLYPQKFLEYLLSNFEVNEPNYPLL